MATAINSYSNKTTPVGADKVLGTDSVDNGTHNFLLSDIQSFVLGSISEDTDSINIGKTLEMNFRTTTLGADISYNLLFKDSDGDNTASVGAVSKKDSTTLDSYFVLANAGGGYVQIFDDTLVTNGISFSSSSAALNPTQILDDYEEDTWTPASTGVGTLHSVAANSAVYTKIGDLVTLNATITITTTLLGSLNAVALTGLPFTASGFFYGTAGGAAGTGTVEVTNTSTPIVIVTNAAISNASITMSVTYKTAA